MAKKEEIVWISSVCTYRLISKDPPVPGTRLKRSKVGVVEKKSELLVKVYPAKLCT